MGKRNKKKLKQRKKRQLKKAIKQVAGKSVQIPDYLPPVVEPPVNTEERYKAKDKSFQDNLDQVYGGTVNALTHYVNNHCSMTYKCNSCGLVFFGKAGHIISDKVHQRHECGMPYGTVEGERFATVSSKHKRKGKNLSKQREQQFFDMLWNDYTPQEIASKLKVNPNIIKEYFIKEGLIEVESGQ
ncbi:adenylate kinase [Cytobacillus firmus]|uniref:adenylate kinase n=1 Tax=Cytobacillus oceanisediminis TaxID=665099 RepID=UPI00203EDB13|nr:adenylate kinase [Cytobacillus oceanisediminis]MCM3246537.1 adenylate kinase [Cytobacillus oceanisediminis]MCS0822707.1 adenylate kinase [Cytobacillus firmus]